MSLRIFHLPVCATSEILAYTTEHFKNHSGDRASTCACTGLGCHLNHGVYGLILESAASHSPLFCPFGCQGDSDCCLHSDSMCLHKACSEPVSSLCAVCAMQMTCHSLRGTRAWNPNMVHLKRVSLFRRKHTGQGKEHSFFM